MQTRHDKDELIRMGNRFRDLLKVMTIPERNFITIIIVYSVLVSLINLAIPATVQFIINNLGVRHLYQPIIILATTLLIFLTFGGILTSFQTYTMEWLKRRLFVRYGAVIMERMMSYQDEHFKQINTQYLINKYSNVMIAQNSMISFIVDGSVFLFQAVIGLTMLAFYHPIFLLFSITIVVMILVDWMLFGPAGVAAGSPEAEGKFNVEAWMEEMGRTRYLFMSRSGFNFAIHKFRRVVAEWIIVRNNLFKQQFRQHVGLQIINAVVYSSLIGVGGVLVINQQLSIGQLVAATLVISMILSNLSRLQNFFLSVYDYSTALDMIAHFYDTPIEKEHYTFERPQNYSITFDNVHYDPNYEFNFSIEEGKKYFIYNASFSATQIFIELLMGFKTPKAGRVVIGGNNIVDYDYKNLRDGIQVIHREAYLNGSVRENITMLLGSSVSVTEIESSLKKVGMLETVNSLPNGYETVVLPHGYPLTQSQILALQFAKAFIQKPSVLIITPDFEMISYEKRVQILQEVLSPEHNWTVLFFTQRSYRKFSFDHYTNLRRRTFEEFKNREQLQQAVAQYE